jgi:hypothetical protein
VFRAEDYLGSRIFRIDGTEREKEHTMTAGSYFEENSSSAQAGIALITTLLALALLTILALGLTAIGTTALLISRNDRETSDVHYIAESGLVHAKELIAAAHPDNLDPLLTAGDGVACNNDELSGTPPFPLVAGDNIPAAGRALASGSYRVSICDDADDANLLDDTNSRIRIVSTATGPNGSRATIEMIASRTLLPGILANGNLRLNGSPAIAGTQGAVHANGTLELPGSPCAEQYFSASGSIVGDGESGAGCSGSPASGTPPGDLRPNQPLIEVPSVEPATFKNQADYVLGPDGLIRTPSAVVLGNATGGSWNGWSWDPGNKIWDASNAISAGTYYAEGSNIKISGNPGSGGPPGTPPIALSLIAQGWVDISGNPSMQPDLTLGGKQYSVIAGKDLKISGNPSNPYQGLFYAGDQISLSGNPTVNGQVIVKNTADNPFPNPGGINLVQLQAGGYMDISGNATITYNGLGGLAAVNRIGWRECRGANADPCQ